MENLEKTMVENGLEVKDSTSQTALFDSINIAKEVSYINKDILLSSTRIDDNNSKAKLYIGTEKVSMKFSKKGYLYFTLKSNYIQGSTRSFLLNYLRANLSTSYLTKLGKYEVEVAHWNNTELYLLIDITSNNVSFIVNKDRLDEMLSDMSIATKREDLQSSPKVDYHINSSTVETVGISADAMFGSLYESKIVDKLEIVKEVIGEAKEIKNSPDVKALLEEIKDMLEDI